MNATSSRESKMARTVFVSTGFISVFCASCGLNDLCASSIYDPWRAQARFRILFLRVMSLDMICARDLYMTH